MKLSMELGIIRFQIFLSFPTTSKPAGKKLGAKL